LLEFEQSSLKIIAGRASGGFEGTRHPRLRTPLVDEGVKKATGKEVRRNVHII
jgi:hypothetical protein